MFLIKLLHYLNHCNLWPNNENEPKQEGFLKQQLMNE